MPSGLHEIYLFLLLITLTLRDCVLLLILKLLIFLASWFKFPVEDLIGTGFAFFFWASFNCITRDEAQKSILARCARSFSSLYFSIHIIEFTGLGNSVLFFLFSEAFLPLD